MTTPADIGGGSPWGFFGGIASRIIRGGRGLPPRFPAGSPGERIGQSVIAGLFGRRLPPVPRPPAPGPAPGPGPNISGPGLDRDLYGLPSAEARRIQSQRDAAKLAKLNRTLRARQLPQLRAAEWVARQLRGRLGKLGKRIRGARGLRWVFANGRWWQVGRGVLRGGAASAVLTGVLNLPSPAPIGRPRVRVIGPGGQRGPWRYQDPRTGRYTLPAPTARPGGAPTGAGGRVTRRPTPPAAAGPGVLKPVTVTAKRVPVPPTVIRPPPSRWMQLARLAQRAAPLVPLLLQGKKSAPSVSISAFPGAGFPSPQPSPAPFPLTGFQGAGVRSGKCECPPKRPRKPKQRRTVCYRGSYVETATGLRKTKREKVPCQPSSARRR